MSADTPRSLGELESAVMSALWRSTEHQSVREVLGALRRRPAPAYTTVMTVLDRLHAKGVVERIKDGKAYLYRPSMTREQWLGTNAARTLSAGHGPPTSAVLMAFLDSAEDIDPGVVDRLATLIADRRKGS